MFKNSDLKLKKKQHGSMTVKVKEGSLFVTIGEIGR
jgi:hypothetical protein